MGACISAKSITLEPPEQSFDKKSPVKRSSGEDLVHEREQGERDSDEKEALEEPPPPIAMDQRIIGNWIIGDTLGEGGYSKVKLGTHIHSGDHAALKILQKNRFTMRDSQLKQVKAEIDAMAKIRHKNVISLIEVDLDAKYPKRNGTLQDVMLVVLELAGGGEFFDFLSYTGSFEESVARSYFHQLVAGLSCCHDNHVAHRDIKPENLLLDDKFVLKIADFGFSKVLAGEDDTMRTECGTRGYMAPEILKHDHYSTKADIFSAGVVLFICLAGFPPFQIATRQDWWFHKLLTNRHGLFWEAHTRAAYFSDTAKDFINKILDPNPETRMSLDQIQEHEWFQGKTISDEVLLGELARRKQKVDAKKAEEMRRNGHAGQVNVGGTVHRAVELGGGTAAAGVGYDDDEEPGSLPPGNPSYAGLVGGKNAAFEPDQPELSTAGAAAAGTPVSPRLKPVPQPYDASTHIKGYTQFHSRSSPSEIIEQLCVVLKTLRAQTDVSDELFRIQSRISDDAGVIKFVAQIFTVPDVAGLYLVDFRRRQGNPMEYTKLYNLLVSQLSAITVPNPNAPAEEPEEEDEQKGDDQ